MGKAKGPGDDTATDEPRPPWWREPKRRSARQPLTREAIVDAAVRILDGEGADALTVRRLAQELDTGAATLYWHISGKDELCELVYDRIMGDVELPEPDPSRWEEQIKDLARQGYRVMLSHNDAVKLSIGKVPAGPNMLRMIEWLLGLLRSAGVPDNVAAYFGDLLCRYIDGSVLEDTGPSGPVSETAGLSPPAPKGTAKGAGKDRASNDEAPFNGIALMHDYMSGLPPDQFPNIISMVDVLFKGDSDDRFELGLDILIRGMSTYIPTRQ
jgi:TetR/AcrR family transcriptional regulator, tetracycline repressor protein